MNENGGVTININYEDQKIQKAVYRQMTTDVFLSDHEVSEWKVKALHRKEFPQHFQLFSKILLISFLVAFPSLQVLHSYFTWANSSSPLDWQTIDQDF
uniref:Uncharacterized protein n=1 Tax=Megaselia scalaris TaxID=36166 RepID=T1GTN8_MEGSC